MTKKQHTILNPIVERSENLAYIYFADLQEGGSSVNPCMLTKEELTQEDLFNDRNKWILVIAGLITWKQINPKKEKNDNSA